MTGADDLETPVGTTLHTVDGFAIAPGKVEEFARAVHDDNPVHRDADAAAEQGFAAVPAPLTFTRTSTFPRYGTDESLDLGFDPAYVIHGEHEYEFARPVLVGDVLTGETTVTDAYERDGRRGGTMTFAEVETVYRDADGERVLSERATVIETDGAIEDDADGSDEHPADASVDDGTEGSDGGAPTDGADPWTADPAVEAVAPDPVGPGELSTGDPMPERSAGPLARRDFVRYAGASGDFNPIHYDEPYARRVGNPTVFGQGMFTAGVAAHAVADWLGLARVGTFGVRFQSRVWPGDVVTARGEVTDIERETSERLDADLLVERHRPESPDETETVLSGWASATLDG